VVSWSKVLYRVRASFPAPLDFVYGWCTDFSPHDSAITGEKYRRRVLERTPSRVVFEDLATTPAGWSWLRNVVDLRPPDRWHLHAVGNSLDAKADYQLISRSANESELRMTWRLRPGILGGTIPPKPSIEASLRQVWRTYSMALGKDFRSYRRREGKPSSRGRRG
jgi:hypothetical protein